MEFRFQTLRKDVFDLNDFDPRTGEMFVSTVRDGNRLTVKFDPALWAFQAAADNGVLTGPDYYREKVNGDVHILIASAPPHMIGGLTTYLSALMRLNDRINANNVGRVGAALHQAVTHAAQRRSA